MFINKFNNLQLCEILDLRVTNNEMNNKGENEFLSLNPHESQMANSRSMSTDLIIDKLQQKNNNLKRQVNKIDRVLSSMKFQQKPRYGIVLPQIKPDTVKKQLDNAYKQIKIYQYEIEKRRNAVGSEAAYVEQINKIEKIYKQKVEIHERLKRDMLVLKNQSKQVTKSLKNDGKKHEYQYRQAKLTTDIKYLQQKVRQYQQKRTFHIGQLQKQRLAIKQFQKQILKQNSNQYLQSIKQKHFKPNQNLLNPSRSIYDIQNETLNQQSRMTKQSIIDQIEQKTPEIYQSLLNDARLLKKMQGDYQAKITLITKERDQASERNFRSRNKLLEVEFDIETIEKNIAQLKTMIDPKMLKPKLIEPIQKKKQVVKKKGPSISHQYKNIQEGQITKNGKRFSDRTAIGKKTSKIIGITLYQRQQSAQFVGFQATYQVTQKTSSSKKGSLNMLLDPKKDALTSQNLGLPQGDFFKTIDVFSKKKKIIGISLVSSKNKIIKAGDLSGDRSSLNMKQSQYPMCFYGSMLIDGFQCFGIEIFAEEIKN